MMTSPPNQRLYNSRVIDTYLRLLQKSYPQVDIPLLLDYSGMKHYQIIDPGHWFSQEQIDRFYDKLVELCKNPDIAREAGQYAASAESLGPFRQYIMGMLGPSNAFAFISKTASRLTRSASYSSRRLGPRKIEIDVRPYPGAEEKEFQCANRLGWFEAVVDVFDQKMEEIEHPQCLFRGDAVCRYVISWTNVPVAFWKRIRNFGLLSLPPLFVASYLFSSSVSPLFPLLGGGLIVSLLALFAEIEDKIRLKSQVDQVRQETEVALNKINSNYDNALLTDEIGRAISQETHLQTILQRVVELISQRMGYDRVMFFLFNREQACLELRAEYGFSKHNRIFLNDLCLSVEPSYRESFVYKSFCEQESIVVENVVEMIDFFSPDELRLIKELRAESFLCCPIVCNGTSLGILAADKKAKNLPLSQTDLSLMDGVAAYIGIALRNADLLEGMERQLKQIREKDEELARHRKNLEEQVKIRTIQLLEASRAAEAANQAKSEFLANMSHEIRTPMTVFMSAIEHLLQIDLNPERRHLLGMADQSAKRLRSLIDDILDFSRIEAGKVEIEEEAFDLRTCVCEAVEMFALSAREKGLQLTVEIAPGTPERLVGDHNRLGQVLINLIGNAVKFTHQGEIRVCIEPRGDLLEFTVADNGIGIPEEKRGLLFKSFSQVDSSFTRQYGGTGLGLAISKGLIELMGGEIWVQSREGNGSVFTFTVPLKAAEKPGPSPIQAPSENTGKERVHAHILLAEDDPMIRNMITMILAQAGWQAETAETGRDALEKWENEHYDFILMDLQMPEMNGLEATQAIRKREAERGKRTTIIGLTAHASRETKEECLASGMDQVLTKPVQIKSLLSAIAARRSL
jgi:signal transduction histidine kinase/CheY-like chemotaxis protein